MPTKCLNPFLHTFHGFFGGPTLEKDISQYKVEGFIIFPEIAPNDYPYPGNKMACSESCFKISFTQVVKQMWAYIKENKLQDPNNKQWIICDEKLSKIVPEERFKGFGMTKYLKNHMVCVWCDQK